MCENIFNKLIAAMQKSQTFSSFVDKSQFFSAFLMCQQFANRFSLMIPFRIHKFDFCNRVQILKPKTFVRLNELHIRNCLRSHKLIPLGDLVSNIIDSAGIVESKIPQIYCGFSVPNTLTPNNDRSEYFGTCRNNRSFGIGWPAIRMIMCLVGWFTVIVAAVRLLCDSRTTIISLGPSVIAVVSLLTRIITGLLWCAKSVGCLPSLISVESDRWQIISVVIHSTLLARKITLVLGFDSLYRCPTRKYKHIASVCFRVCCSPNAICTSMLELWPTYILCTFDVQRKVYKYNSAICDQHYKR